MRDEYVTVHKKRLAIYLPAYTKEEIKEIK